MDIRGFLSSVAILLAMLPAMAQEAGAAWNGVIGRTAGESEPDYAGPPRFPGGAPDVVLIVLDEVGFAGLGAFGARIDTPHLDRLAREGVRYTGFNIAPVGAATRAALLTGRDPHGIGMADNPEAANGFPNRNGEIPDSIPLLPALLKLHGYATFAVGQWHLTPLWALSAATGHFETWPTGRGFDHFYGWLAGSPHQNYPELYRDTTAVVPLRTPDQGYHASEDLVDNAIRYIDDLRSADPARPYFLYLAFGAPRQAPRTYRELYRGRFSQGWDREREMVLERQKAQGVVPPEVRLPPRDPGIPEWNTLDPDRQALSQLFMENHAAFLTHADAQIGRLVEHLRAAGRLENTLILALSAQSAGVGGGRDGALNGVAKLNGVEPELGEMLARREQIGEIASAPLLPWGWASVGNLPFRGGTGSADNGGIRVPLIVYWPKGMTGLNAVRPQWQSVTDIVPTVLDLLKVPPPAEYRGMDQPPFPGRSFLASLTEVSAPATHATQYWEYRGNRALYHRGWKAVATHSGLDGKPARPGDFDHDTWRLYRVESDFAEVEDVAGKHPDKLAEMTARFWSEAGRQRVFPLDDREPSQLAAAREAALSEARTRQFTFFPGMSPLPEVLAPHLFGKSHSVTVFLEHGGPRTQGVLAAQGGINGGWVLYIREGKPRFVYNVLGTARYVIEGADEVPTGRVKVRYKFSKSRNHKGRGELFIDDRKVGEAPLDRLVPATFGGEPFDVGRDSQSPVIPEYQPPFAYGGRIEKVEVNIEN